MLCAIFEFLIRFRSGGESTYKLLRLEIALSSTEC